MSRPGRSLPPGKDRVPIVQEAGWAPGPVWTGAEKLAPTGIRSSDRPARSQSLYRLSYPACNRHNQTKFNVLQISCGILFEKFATTAGFYPLYAIREVSYNRNCTESLFMQLYWPFFYAPQNLFLIRHHHFPYDWKSLLQYCSHTEGTAPRKENVISKTFYL